jgi:hypothetical protein
MNKKIKVEFAPGCFDEFDGTQEELDQLIAEITRLAESGELQERSRPVDLDNIDEEDLEVLEKLMQDADPNEKRNLQ